MTHNLEGVLVPDGIAPIPCEPKLVVDLNGRVCDPDARTQIAALEKKIEVLQRYVDRAKDRFDVLEARTGGLQKLADDQGEWIDGLISKVMPEGDSPCDPSEP